jgi:NDP-hexose-3-ketoreductase
MDMDKHIISMLRVGVMGCAKFAIRSLIPELHRHPAFQLVALASRDRKKAEAVAKDYGCLACTYDELLDQKEIDVVYVPLPTGLHAEWVMKCLAMGKHVLCEKSLGCTLAEVETMVALAKEQKCMLMENFQFRFHTQHAAVKKLIASGIIGEIRCFRSSFGFPPFSDGADNIRYKRELGGGALLDAGAYTLKATTFMLGEHFEVKAATLKHCAEYGVDIGGAIYLESDSGLVSQTAFGFDNFYQCNYEIWGSEGKLTACRAFTAPPGFSPEIRIELKTGTKVQSLTPDNHFEKMLTYLSRSVSNGSYGGEYEENLVQARLLQQTFDVSNQ